MGKHRKTAVTGPATWAFLLSLLIGWSGPQAAACGYHDDVSLARGVLNWTYPDALHVVGAISTAVAERRLPAPAPAGGGFGLLGYHGIARALDQHAQQLRSSSDEKSQPSFSLLLIEAMLWSRFVSEGGDVQPQVHVPGPQAGDLVVISGEDVIREIVHSRLSIGEAYRHGLIRLYGTEEQLRAFLARYDQVGSMHSN
ncbi:MAG: hypothetical protein ACT4OC_00150 [Bradyrhizobium sp.]